MQELISKIASFKEEVTFESLKHFLTTFDLENLQVDQFVKEPESEGDYGRNILILEPFECVLINWPPGAESAIHHHQGLFGYVYVFEGELDNVLYREEEGTLVEYDRCRYVKRGLMPEPDGVIHKIANPSRERRAITLHFYHPALETLEGLKIFNAANGDIGVLSKDAKTASWSEEEGHFKETQREQFSFVSFEEFNKSKSHCISYVIPKPEREVIGRMNADYFSEQAEQYDFSDFNQPNRNKYISRVNKIIADEFEDKTPEKVMDIATGTGRRAVAIRDLSKCSYQIIGVDISEGMLQVCAERGIETYLQNWEIAEDITEHRGEIDAITFLYAFGHISDREARVKTLKKIHRHLKKGGYLFVDLFSVDNENEWGPKAKKAFENRRLDHHGYESGDVFYTKLGLKSIAFLHYFCESEIKAILQESGFEIEKNWYVGYAKNAGEFVNDASQGNIFIKAKKV